jgi:hypothetical protein
MKNLLALLFITLVSAVAIANSPFDTPKTIEAEQQTMTQALQTESSARSEITLAQSEISKVSGSELWKTLDVNQDDSISKSEAIYSQEVFENWDKLDINKDEKLDLKEFAQLFSEKN